MRGHGEAEEAALLRPRLPPARVLIAAQDSSASARSCSRASSPRTSDSSGATGRRRLSARSCPPPWQGVSPPPATLTLHRVPALVQSCSGLGSVSGSGTSSSPPRPAPRGSSPRAWRSRGASTGCLCSACSSSVWRNGRVQRSNETRVHRTPRGRAHAHTHTPRCLVTAPLLPRALKTTAGPAHPRSEHRVIRRVRRKLRTVLCLLLRGRSSQAVRGGDGAVLYASTAAGVHSGLATPPQSCTHIPLTPPPVLIATLHRCTAQPRASLPLCRTRCCKPDDTALVTVTTSPTSLSSFAVLTFSVVGVVINGHVGSHLWVAFAPQPLLSLGFLLCYKVVLCFSLPLTAPQTRSRHTHGPSPPCTATADNDGDDEGGEEAALRHEEHDVRLAHGAAAPEGVHGTTP